MLRQTVEAGEIRRAVIVGGGFIGLEIAENLAAKDVKVSVIDFAPHILPGFLDPEIADYVENKLADAGVMCFTGTGLEEILGEEKVEKVKTSRRAMKAGRLHPGYGNPSQYGIFAGRPVWKCSKELC